MYLYLYSQTSVETSGSSVCLISKRQPQTCSWTLPQSRENDNKLLVLQKTAYLYKKRLNTNW